MTIIVVAAWAILVIGIFSAIIYSLMILSFFFIYFSVSANAVFAEARSLVEETRGNNGEPSRYSVSVTHVKYDQIFPTPAFACSLFLLFYPSHLNGAY